MEMKVWPGLPYPLGATWDGGGVNFALFAENASGVELCLFDAPVGLQEVARIPMYEQTDQVWPVYLPEARPGWLYGYRVSGPYEPAAGHRFNPAKLLGLWLAGDAIAEVDSRGNRIVDDTLLILLNAYHEPLRFILPSHPSEVRWQVLLDTREALGRWRYRPIQAGQAYELGARTLALLRLGTDD